jgi:hypothetical protein
MNEASAIIKVEKGNDALIRLKALTAMADGLLRATDLDNQASAIDWMFENLVMIGGIEISSRLV